MDGDCETQETEEDMSLEYGPEEISDLDAGSPLHGAEPVYRLEHFKVNYDPTWDYEGVAESMFDGPRILVMPEKKLMIGHHVHFQGYTSYSQRTFVNMRGKLALKHYTRTTEPKNPNSRPCSAGGKASDETGFQYMCKEGIKPLYSKGFTQAELEELQAKSDAHVEKLKVALEEYLRDEWKKKWPEAYVRAPEEVWGQLQLMSRGWYEQNKKKAGRFHRQNVVEAMCTLHNKRDKWIEFALNKL